MLNKSFLIFVRILAMTAFSGIADPITAQSGDTPLSDASILALMEKELIPGIALAVIEGDDITFKTYGVKNAVESEAVNFHTMFETASLTKPVTAYISMRMWEDGLLDLNKPLSEYVTYEAISHDERHRQITARMVLNHTSGLPNARARDGLEIYVNPGEKFGYSGEAFRYLQAAIQSISGKSLDKLAEEYVFEPLDMPNSSYVWRQEFTENRAVGHDQDGEVSREMHQLPRAYAEGGLVSNIEDYSKFASAVLQKYQDDDRAVLEMLAPSVQARVNEGRGTIAWGLGWGLDIAEEGIRAWHTGTNGAFQSFIVLDLAKNTGVVCFINSANGLNVISEILELTIGEQRLSQQYQSTIVESMIYSAAN